MKWTSGVSCALGLVLLVASCEGTRGAGHLGISDLSEDYAPVDQQLVFGWSVTEDQEQSGLSYEVGVGLGYDAATLQGFELSSTNLELYGGPHYEWVLGEVRPFLSGGVSLLASSYEGHQGFVTVSDDDTSFGFYVGGGVDVDLTEQLFLGLGVRQTFAHEVTFYGLSGDADLAQLLLRLGGSF